MKPQIGMILRYVPLDADGKRAAQKGSVILLALGAFVVVGLLSTALGL